LEEKKVRIELAKQRISSDNAGISGGNISKFKSEEKEHRKEVSEQPSEVDTSRWFEVLNSIIIDPTVR
jgi:hypothetical protein